MKPEILEEIGRIEKSAKNPHEVIEKVIHLMAADIFRDQMKATGVYPVCQAVHAPPTA
jgi:hypothetical protein